MSTMARSAVAMALRMKLVDDFLNIGFWSEDYLRRVVEVLHTEAIETVSVAGAGAPDLEFDGSSGSGV